MSIVNEEFNHNNLEHLAIIMDGNRRWAAERSMPKTSGHIEGVKSLKEIVRACIELNIKYLTIFAFSSENWLREESEKNFLFKLMKNTIEKNINKFVTEGVRLNFIGDLSVVPKPLQESIQKVEKLDIPNEKFVVNVALNYGGRWDICSAAKKLCQKVIDNQLDVNGIDENTFSSSLALGSLPDVDLLIRTSGEQRLSNFILWQISYAELYFESKHWPDFKGEDLKKAIDWYMDRERRYGGS